jgi:hypothetical protein
MFGANSSSAGSEIQSALGVVTQFFTGGSSIRQILAAVDMRDVPSIPLTEFFLDLNFSGVVSMVRGNLDYLVQMHPRVRENIRNMQARHSPLDLPSLVPGFNEFSFRDCFLQGITVPEPYDFDEFFRTGLSAFYDRAVQIVLNYEGQEFVRQISRESLFLGEFVDRLANILPRGEAQIIDVMLQGANLGMASVMVRPVLGRQISSARQTYLKSLQDRQPEVDAVTRTLRSWESQISRDQVVQTSMAPQRPLSIAYRSADPLHPIAPIENSTELFREVVSEVFNAHEVNLPETVPVSILQAHEADLATRLRERARGDHDFNSEMFPALDRELSKP